MEEKQYIIYANYQGCLWDIFLFIHVIFYCWSCLHNPEFIIIKSYMINPKQTPVALLVIYDPGFKFRYKKYYLKKGINLIGYHPSCDVQILQGSGSPQKAAKLFVTNDLDLAVIQSMEAKTVHVPSNMQKKSNVMVELQVGAKYIIEMEKEFMICGRKTLMQISPLQQLLQLKGVVNKNLFELLSKDKSPSPMAQQNPVANNPEAHSFQPTLPLQDNNVFEATIQMDNAYEYYQATQLIEDENVGYYQATLPMDADYDIIPESYRKQPSSIKMVQKIEPSLKKSNKDLQEPEPKASFEKDIPHEQNKQIKQIIESSRKGISEAEISMPSTIKDQDQMPQTIRDQMPPTIKEDSQMVFPPTLQEDDKFQHKLSEIKKKTTNMTKSSPAYRQIKQQKLEKKNNLHSLLERNPMVQSFDSLFDDPHPIESTHKTISGKPSTSVVSKKRDQQNKRQIKQTHSENASEKTQKLSENQNNQNGREEGIFTKNFKRLQKSQQSKNGKSQQSKKEQNQLKNLKKCYVVGKISKNDTQKLKKKGYNIIAEDDAAYFPQLILIQGEAHANRMILISLITGKQFKPISWLNNQSSKLAGKLQGFLWDHILKRKGKGNKIFDNSKNFYLQEDLRSEFGEVMQAGGAKFITELTKTKSRSKVYIIVDEKSQQGSQLFEEWKNYKNWGFYSKKMIIESVLMGEEILDKYKLDSYSF